MLYKFVKFSITVNIVLIAIITIYNYAYSINRPLEELTKISNAYNTLENLYNNKQISFQELINKQNKIIEKISNLENKHSCNLINDYQKSNNKALNILSVPLSENCISDIPYFSKNKNIAYRQQADYITLGAIGALKVDKVNKSISLLNAVLNKIPDDSHAYYLFGICFYKDGNIDKAKECLTISKTIQIKQFSKKYQSMKTAYKFFDTNYYTSPIKEDTKLSLLLKEFYIDYSPPYYQP
ncbi:MAG: hypothetical protein AB1782_14115 [Cyanobacteriota bacterium]